MKNNKLQDIHTSGFKTPKDYFSKVEEQILDELNLKTKVEQSGFKVPDSYFDTLESKILHQVSSKNDVKVIPLQPWKKILYATAVAASLILMFNVFFKSSEQLKFEDIELSSIENYLVEGDYTSYELATLLTEEELSSFNTINSEISIDSIEDYLLDNATIEDLIIE